MLLSEMTLQMAAHASQVMKHNDEGNNSERMYDIYVPCNMSKIKLTPTQFFEKHNLIYL